LPEYGKQLLKKHRRLFTVSAYNYTLGTPTGLTDPNGKSPCYLLPLGLEDVVLTVQAMFGCGEAQQRAQQKLTARAKARAAATAVVASVGTGGSSALSGAVAGGTSQTVLDAGNTALTQYGNEPPH
jgi:hypothetical protein